MNVVSTVQMVLSVGCITQTAFQLGDLVHIVGDVNVDAEGPDEYINAQRATKAHWVAGTEERTTNKPEWLTGPHW